MAGRAETLFAQLQSAAAVRALIGEAEDAHLDCKEWPARDVDPQKMLAKAICGLANADGGVLVIGMRAESRPKDEPDLITAEAPVDDTSYVKSRVLGSVGNIVEPGVVGLVAAEIGDKLDSTSGFVIVYVPKSEGPPARSRKDWKFYQRIGSATLPMDYWQIEAAFGRRPNPRLSLHLEVREAMNHHYTEQKPLRSLVLGVKNEGAGIAKFPGIRFRRDLGLKVDPLGIDGNVGFGIPLRASEQAWIVFRGGVDDVVYPGETRLIGHLFQVGIDKGIGGIPITMNPNRHNRWEFEATTFACELFCEGQPTTIATKPLPMQELIVTLP